MTTTRIQHVADALLDRVQLRGHSSDERSACAPRFDLIDDYAYPLPLTVIAELLGIPDDDHEPFRRWSHAAVANDVTGDA